MSRPANKDSKYSFALVDVRAMYFPLGLSLALHALIFWSAHELVPSPDAPAAQQHDLRASLQKMPSAAPIEKPVFDPDSSSRIAPERQPEKPAKAQPEKPRAIDGIAKGPLEREYAEAPSTPRIEPIRSGIDLVGLRQYHLALGKKARQFRRYPEEARAAGWRGRVTMRLVVSETGYPLGISLLDSSGFPVLDRTALEMMLLSASHTEVPESLRGRTFNIDLAIDYSPDDGPFTESANRKSP